MTELSASLEDYLEAIFHIEADIGVARAKEIAKRLKVSYSSVTKALRALVEKELIDYEPYGLVKLTNKGKRLARDVAHRHQTLKDFLTKVLFIDEAEADEVACKLEHEVSKKVVDRLVKFVDYVEACPHASVAWLEGFGFHCEESPGSATCPHCEPSTINDLVHRRKSSRKRKSP
jgi:DtxR family Mn-dependent transcriptional regulator